MAHARMTRLLVGAAALVAMAGPMRSTPAAAAAEPAVTAETDGAAEDASPVLLLLTGLIGLGPLVLAVPTGRRRGGL